MKIWRLKTLKNYYEILEIDKNASQEIIDKAHKVLVKKYHPDLQNTEDEKIKSEAKIKEINEAYEILSNKEKRAKYDNSLKKDEEIEQERILQEQLEHELNKQAYNQNTNTTDYSNIPHNQSNINQQQRENNIQFQQDYEDAINQAYHDAYVQDMKNRGYRIKYKKTWNERLRSLIALLLTIGVILLILQIPFVKEYFYSLYRDNEVIHNIVDGIANWFK